MKRFFVAIAAALFAVPLAAQNQATAPAEAPATRIGVPFNPPLDRPVRYRVTATKVRNNAPMTVWVDYELGFSRRPEGYRLAVRTVDAGTPGAGAVQNAAVRRTIVNVAPPYALLLAGDGAIEAMEDADAYWENMLAATAQLLRSEPGRNGRTDEAALALVIDQMRRTSPEARLAMTTENIAPILQFGGGDFIIGEERQGEDRIEGPMGLVFQTRTSLRADRVADGRLFLSMRSNIPDASIRQAFEAFSSRIPVTGQGLNTQAERDRVAAQMRTARFEQQSDVAFEVALDTGLVHRMSATDRNRFEIGTERGARTETQLIERRD